MISPDDNTGAAPTAAPAPAPATQAPQSDDLFLPSFFVCAASVILAIQNPINYQFQARPWETLALTAIGVVLVAVGTFRRVMPLLYAGVAWLLIMVTLGVATQPSLLTVPLVAIWPLRLALVLLVGLSWAFLMRPHALLRRALIAFTIPTLLALAAWGGPATAASLFGLPLVTPVHNFTPFWLTLDSKGTLYATDALGGLVWVFDATGSPQGTLRPAKAPPLPTPGPGIIPNGLEEEINLSAASILPTPTAGSGAIAGTNLFASFEFCGIGTDKHNNFYTLDLLDPKGVKLLRFNPLGIITARFDVPPGYESTTGCLAVDDDYIYLSSKSGQIFVLDYDAKQVKDFKLGFQPFGISAPGNKRLTVISPGKLTNINVSAATTTTTTLPGTVGDLQIPMLALPNGDTYVTNHRDSKVVRVDPSGKIVSTIGGQGAHPGELGGVGSLALDKQGRLYVADWQHRVIQRFTPDGKVDAVWWATSTTPEGEID